MTGEQLREALTSLNKTQEELARDLGVATSTVNRWINKGKKPNKLTRDAITKQIDSYRIEADKLTSEAV